MHFAPILQASTGRLAGALLLVASLGCPGPTPVPDSALIASLPECPHDWADRLKPMDTFRMTASGELSVPGPITNVPEYHDCQRFPLRDPTPGGPTYDSLFAVFVRYDVGAVYQNWNGRREDDTVSIRGPRGAATPPTRASEGATTPASPASSGGGNAGNLAGGGAKGPTGISLGNTASPATSPSATAVGATSASNGGQVTNAPATLADLAGGVIVGVVLAEGDYSPLGITRGFDCLVLSKNGSGYLAYMIAVGKTDGACFNLSAAVISSITRLNVTVLREAETGINEHQYPPVARWDWDRENGEQYIGLYCPGGWCEITKDQTYLSSIVYADRPSTIALGEKRIWRGKGWYDEQRVANYVGGKTLAGGPHGTAFPSRKLADYELKDYQSHWRHVATVVLRENSPTYADKYAYRASDLPPTLGQGVNVIEMCTDSIPDAAVGQPHRRTDDPCGVRLIARDQQALQNCKSAWYARVLPHNGRPRRVFCVKYRGFAHGFSIPAVVRWRWRANDETLWIRCPTGCCELDNAG